MAWYDHLEYGDPVVCVDGDDHPLLRTGRVYRFKALEHDDDDESWSVGKYASSRILIVLIEVQNLYFDGDIAPGFAAERFRPATSTDLPASIRDTLKTPAPKEKV